MAKIAGETDIDLVTEIIALAFVTDPVWGVAIARPDGSSLHAASFWRPYVEGAMVNSGVYLNDAGTAISVWIRPGCQEMTDDQQARVLEVVESSLPPASTPAMLELWERFDSAHPQDEPHAYLSFLATHPGSRGHGVGQQLLRENLEEFDQQGMPAYLESTNPANNHRYERAGFVSIGQFESTFNSAPIETMWRQARGLASES